MKTELLEFYREAFVMGEFLLEFIGPDHQYFPLVNFMVKNKPLVDKMKIPSLESTCEKVGISRPELETFLGSMREKIECYLVNDGAVDHETPPSFNLPFKGTLFFFIRNDHMMGFITTSMKHVLQEGDKVHSGIFPTQCKNRYHHVCERLVEITCEGFMMVYFLDELAAPGT
jgi:hypothetical protein